MPVAREVHVESFGDFVPNESPSKKKEVTVMAVKNIGEKYLCKRCGNEVSVTRVGGGTLKCCGKDMEKISHRDEQGEPSA